MRLNMWMCGSKISIGEASEAGFGGSGGETLQHFADLGAWFARQPFGRERAQVLAVQCEQALGGSGAYAVVAVLEAADETRGSACRRRHADEPPGVAPDGAARGFAFGRELLQHARQFGIRVAFGTEDAVQRQIEERELQQQLVGGGLVEAWLADR